MKYRVIASWLVDPTEHHDVEDSGPGARELAQAMIQREADLPDSVQMAVFEADPGDLDGEPHDMTTVSRLTSIAQVYYQLPTAIFGR